MKVEVPFSEIRTVFHHIERFHGLSCAVDLMKWKVFPNAKEITESMGAFEALRKNKLAGKGRPFEYDDRDVVCICVGDGRSPRTGALVACRTAWAVYSVDPNMKLNKTSWSDINRLTLVKDKVENFSIHAKKAIILSVHSHVGLPASIACVTGVERLAVVAIPCCVKQELRVHADTEYRDKGIWSPCNNVKVWFNVAGAE